MYYECLHTESAPSCGCLMMLGASGKNRAEAGCSWFHVLWWVHGGIVMMWVALDVRVEQAGCWFNTEHNGQGLSVKAISLVPQMISVTPENGR